MAILVRVGLMFMGKYFCPLENRRNTLLPACRNSCRRSTWPTFILGLVRVNLDLKEIMSRYPSALSQPPFDPRMMVALLLRS
jgi:hypothetical protein